MGKLGAVLFSWHSLIMLLTAISMGIIWAQWIEPWLDKKGL